MSKSIEGRIQEYIEKTSNWEDAGEMKVWRSKETRATHAATMPAIIEKIIEFARKEDTDEFWDIAAAAHGIDSDFASGCLGMLRFDCNDESETHFFVDTDLAQYRESLGSSSQGVSPEELRLLAEYLEARRKNQK